MELLYIINYDLNKLYIDKFWNNIECEDWIYLDEELIQWFGYKEINRGKESIVKLLKKHHELDEDYKILNNEEYKNHHVCYTHDEYKKYIKNNNKLCSPSGGEQNNIEELKENCSSEFTDEKDLEELEKLEKELVDVFQRMRKHNTKKNIYKTSKDLFTPFHI